MTENTPNSQPPTSEMLIRIENALMAFVASQERVSSQVLSRLDSIETRLNSVESDLGLVKAELGLVKADLGSVKADLSALKVEVAEIREDAKLRYVDLRERSDLTRDKLGIMQRELNELIKDLTRPPFAPTPTR